MSDFLTEDDIVAALAAAGNGGPGCRQDFYKSSLTSAAGYEYSGWMMAGNPGLGSAPGAWSHPTSATAGCWCPNLVNAGSGTNRLLQTEVTMANAGQNFRLMDRLGHMAGLSGTLSTAQAVNATLTAAAADGRCAADGSDVIWFLEWYTATGSSTVVVTVNVTYDDDSTGGIPVTVLASTPAYRMLRIQQMAAGKKSIKAVNSVQATGTTGTVGNYGVTAYKHLGSCSVLTAQYTDKQDFAYLGMPKVGANACIVGTFWAVTTTLGAVAGSMVIGAK